MTYSIICYFKNIYFNQFLICLKIEKKINFSKSNAWKSKVHSGKSDKK